jgi:hypothetical protein
MHDDLNPGVSYRDQGLTIQALYVLNTSPNLARKPWTYGHDIRGREYLSADSDFEALVQELKVAFINTSDADVQFRLEPSCGKYSQDDPLLKRLQCRRASWTARLDTKLLDKFFNGLMGIRAQYYASPYHGGAMNTQLLAALRPRLLELSKQGSSQSDAKLVKDSLAAASAKTWVCEKSLSGEKIIRASDLDLHEEEIQNDWLDLARTVKAGVVPPGQYQLYSAALNGVRAPIADQFEVKGGWITRDEQVEYVTPAKHDRDCQVFMFGFT